MMNKIDGRTIGDRALEERRATIIRMKQNGFTIKQIQTATGCSRQSVYKLWGKLYANKKAVEPGDIIKVKRRGIKPGERRSLTTGQENTVRRILVEKYPDQLKFDFALWTREGVQKLIKINFDIEMPLSTVGTYLRRWNFTPQKPVAYAYERDGLKVAEWLENTYPAIKKRAKRAKADIYWGDETTVKARDVRGRGYAPKGKTPVVNRTEKHENVGMISAITNRGKVSWKLYDGSINSGRVLEFVKQLIKYRRRKIFLILDNAKTHHSRMLREWLKDKEDRIEIFYLPPYSPDLNPDEHINSDVKYGVGSKKPKRKKAELRSCTNDHMLMLNNSPDRIMSYFRDPAIKYAA
jgi:transposase